MMDSLKEEGSSICFPFNKQFLEYAFEKKVERFTVKIGTNPGDNYLSIMYAVAIDFEEEEEEQATSQHYLIKCYPNHAGRREMLDERKFFEAELFIYEEFLPILKETMKAGGAHVGLSAAPFHGGNVASSPFNKWKDTEWASENFIIMSDIRKSGFLMVDRLPGLDLEHATLVLKEMARWHALAWAHKERNGLKLLSEKHPILVDRLYSNGDIEGQIKFLTGQMSQSALRVVEDSLGKGHPAYVSLKGATNDFVETMRKYRLPQGLSEDVFEAMLRIKPEADPNYNKDPWITGIHGDCWVNNLLFRYNAPKGQGSNRPHPVEVTFVDLQAYREACPTMDIAYFLSSSVRAPIRIPQKDQLLQAYHDTFLQCCADLKVNPYPGFFLESLKRRYRRSERFGLLSAIMTLTVVLKPTEDTVDLDKSADGKDDNAMELFSKNIIQGNDKNSKFMEELIPSLLDLYENGVI